MVEIIKDPIADRFYNLVTDSKQQIRLCAPYVKESIVNEIYANKRSNVKVDIISNFSLPNFYKRSSDIEAFNKPIECKDNVYNCQMLHAKLYIFDDKYTIITSSNLTPSGFRKNLEYGVFIKDNILVNQTISDFKGICHNESTGKISAKKIINIQAILKNLPEYKDLNIGLYDEQTEVDSILDVEIELLKSNFSNWQRKTFEVVDSINKKVFSLSDVYAHENTFIKAFPNNNTIKDSIRRNLQELRDLGLIKFYGNGMYRKLWR